MKITPLKFMRWTGLILFPLFLAITGLFAQFSRRQLILFLCSFSFQTSLLGWFSVLTKNPILGQFSIRYLTFVALLWSFSLGGLENSTAEYIFNEILHYLVPSWVYFYHRYAATYFPGVRYWLLGLLYPLGYFFFMLLVNQWIGYELYPVLNTHPVLVVSVFVMVEAMYWTTNNFRVNKP